GGARGGGRLRLPGRPLRARGGRLRRSDGAPAPGLPARDPSAARRRDPVPLRLRGRRGRAHGGRRHPSRPAPHRGAPRRNRARGKRLRRAHLRLPGRRAAGGGDRRRRKPRAAPPRPALRRGRQARRRAGRQGRLLGILPLRLRRERSPGARRAPAHLARHGARLSRLLAPARAQADRHAQDPRPGARAVQGPRPRPSRRRERPPGERLQPPRSPPPEPRRHAQPLPEERRGLPSPRRAPRTAGRRRETMSLHSFLREPHLPVTRESSRRSGRGRPSPGGRGRADGRGVGGEGCARAVLLLLALATAAQAQPPPAPIDSSLSSVPLAPGHYVGIATCGTANCHGNTLPQSGLRVLGNEYFTWDKSDRHRRAYEVLFDARSAAIIRNLGLGPAPDAPACLACHALAVPRAQQAARLEIEDGLSCESCHGPASGWLEGHRAEGWSHADSVRAGLRDLKDFRVRAGLCLSCHLGDSNRSVDHELIAAGHPVLSFELDNFTRAMPPHWKNAGAQGARAWAVGQTAAFAAGLDLLASRTRGERWPEFSELSCTPCHHALAEERWRTERPPDRPGLPRASPARWAVLRHLADAYLPASRP